MRNQFAFVKLVLERLTNSFRSYLSQEYPLRNYFPIAFFSSLFFLIPKQGFGKWKYKTCINLRFLKIGIFGFLIVPNIYSQTVDYADTGNGIHPNKIQWLTWSGTDLDDGIHNGDSVNFNLPLGGNLEVVISNVSIAYPVPDPTPGNGEYPHGYLPSDVNTWCGATFYTAYDLSTSGSEILFSDIDTFGVVGNGENGQDINFDISFKVIINGYVLPADVVTGDPETTNSAFSEAITVTTNRANWALIENIRGTNYLLSGLNTSVVSITDTEIGAACSGGTNSGTNSSPLLLTEGVADAKTQLNYDISYPTGDGHEGIIFGIKLPFDQGDAPSSYQVASHLQEMIPTTSGSPNLINNSKLYLGAIPGDPDYHANNPLFSSAADGDDTDNNNDEDGFSNTSYDLSCGRTTLVISNADITVVNTTGTIAKLHGWIDFDQNGTFDSDEYAVSNVLNTATNPQSDLSFNVPSGFVAGSRQMRFRMSSDTTLDSTTSFGVAVDGEVEDYVLSVTDPSGCPEICGNGFDDDMDGDDDCADSDCIPVVIPRSLSTCDTANGTGYGLFFLYEVNDSVTTTSGVTISYHATLLDAQGSNNDLISPYRSTSTTVYARVENSSTGCYNTTTITLTVGAKCPENCNNGIDEDGDGLIDCEDPDCACCNVQAPLIIGLNKK